MPLAMRPLREESRALPAHYSSSARHSHGRRLLRLRSERETSCSCTLYQAYGTSDSIIWMKNAKTSLSGGGAYIVVREHPRQGRLTLLFAK